MGHQDRNKSFHPIHIFEKTPKYSRVFIDHQTSTPPEILNSTHTPEKRSELQLLEKHTSTPVPFALENASPMLAAASHLLTLAVGSFFGPQLAVLLKPRS